jgi:hypothetical protein
MYVGWGKENMHKHMRLEKSSWNAEDVIKMNH